jgi:uncharacterized protein YkwD
MRPSHASLTLAVFGTLMLAFAAPAVAGGPRLGKVERAIVRTMNHKRAGYGMRGVHPSVRLARAADLHSADMLRRNYFAHSSSNGASFATRIHHYVRAARVGETLALVSSCHGRRAAHLVVRMWMHSPMHRAILLSRSFHRVGVALRRGRLGSRRACVVTADFAR